MCACQMSGRHIVALESDSIVFNEKLKALASSSPGLTIPTEAPAMATLLDEDIPIRMIVKRNRMST